MQVQMTMEGERELDFKIHEAQSIISKAARLSQAPIVINFSGGKDSLTLLDLVSRITNNFICTFSQTGIDFPEVTEFAKYSCETQGYELLISTPDMHKGDFYTRIAQFRKFPTVKETWCNRDLKFRPANKLLRKIYGSQHFYKLNGVRRFESTRRNSMHISTKRLGYIIPDYNTSSDFMVFPILNWTSENVKQYLKENAIRIPTNPLYDKYGVSGCFWCPFYQPSIYKKILCHCPHIYDKIIEWEEILQKPSVSGFQYLRDIKSSLNGGKET